MSKIEIKASGRELGTSEDREIRVIPPELIEDYLTIYLNAYPAYKSVGDEGREKYRKRYLRSMAEDENITFCGLFEKGELIALMKLIDFSMNAFGKMQHATGLMSLAVHPMHKKKKAALDMVRYFEKYTADSGALVAMLLPFRMDFYRNMGYGYGSKLDEYRIPTVSLPPAEDTSRIVFLEAGDMEAILDCHRRFAAASHGMLDKFEDEIRDMAADSESRHVGYMEDGKLRGFAIYSLVSESEVNYTLNSIEVGQLAYDSPEVLRSLLGFLRNQSDLAQTVVIRTGEEDFYHLLPSAQDVSGNYIDFGFLQTNVGAVGTMYKIVDPAHFVEATAYRRFLPMELKARFEYYDELKHESRTLAVVFERCPDGRSSRWRLLKEETDCDIAVRLPLAELSSLFMGSCRLSSLLRLGAAEATPRADGRMSAEASPRADGRAAAEALPCADGRAAAEGGCSEAEGSCSEADILDALLCVKQKPWTNTDY